MIRKLRLSPAMCVALLALLVALSGTAVAASNGLILGSQIKNHSIGASKLTPNAVSFLRGRVGPPGSSGAPGPAGPQGVAGPQSIALDQVLGTAVTQCAAGGGGCQAAIATASCPSDMVAIGGGYVTGTPNDVVAAARVSAATAYRVDAVNYWAAPSWVQAYVVCMRGGLYAHIIIPTAG